jgi:hypothetical protein
MNLRAAKRTLAYLLHLHSTITFWGGQCWACPLPDVVIIVLIIVSLALFLVDHRSG